MKRLLLLTVFCLIGAQGALNGHAEYTASHDFGTGYQSDEATLVTGAIDATLESQDGTYAAFDVFGLEIRSLTEVCWNNGICVQDPTGELYVVLIDGGSAAYQFPAATTGEFSADFVLGFPVDFGQQEDLQEFELGETFLFNAIGGQMESLLTLPFKGQGSNEDSYGGIASILDGTAFEVFRGNTKLATITNDDPIFFSSELGARVSEYNSDFVLVPFAEGSEATLTEAAKDDAQEGFNFESLSSRFNSLGNASEAETMDLPEQLDGVEVLLSEIFAGGIIKVAGGTESAGDIITGAEIVRFSELAIINDGGLQWDAQSALVVRDGTVEGQHKLIGILPWWGYLIIAAAVILLVVRVTLKSPKEGPIDKFQWIGWVAAFLVSLLVFYLWDKEMEAVWGTSILSTDATGTALGAIVILQLVPFLLVSLFVTLPLRVIGSNAVRIAKLGRAARIPTALMPIFGFLIGATLMKDFLGLILETVANNF